MVSQVLCVDDDVISQTISQLLLKKAGFCNNIVNANDGHEALSILQQLLNGDDQAGTDIPDIIFLDLNMPELDGWGFLDQYMANFADRMPNTRIVILSSTIDPADAVRARNYPVVIHFLHKPLQMDNLESLRSHPFVQRFFLA